VNEYTAKRPGIIIIVFRAGRQNEAEDKAGESYRNDEDEADNV
jgi:hypothetical protein